MKQITLQPRKATPALFALLEKRKRVRLLRATARVLNTRTRTGAVDEFYTTQPSNGTHKLLAVGKRSTEIEFSFHSDNEDLILLNATGRPFKPLYLIVALDDRQTFERKARQGTLAAGDLAALELPFNDPRTCVFTVLAGTVHCEVTRPGAGQHPVFFVTEPSKLAMQYPALPGYRFALAEKGKRK